MLPTVTPTTDLALELIRTYRATARELLAATPDDRLLRAVANEWVSLANLVNLANDPGTPKVDEVDTVMADVRSAAEHLENARRHPDLDGREAHLDAARTYIRLVRTSPDVG